MLNNVALTFPLYQASSLPLPFRSLITAGCFTQVTQQVAEGGDLQGKFQQQVRQAFAKARVAGIKQSLLWGAIPFDTQQPSALFIPYESRCFYRATFLAGLSPLATGPEIASITEVPT